jgi:hypothetical protein
MSGLFGANMALTRFNRPPGCGPIQCKALFSTVNGRRSFR